MTASRAETPALLTVPEAAEQLRCSRKTVDRLIKAGYIRPTRVGTLVRITERELAAYVAASTRRGA